MSALILGVTLLGLPRLQVTGELVSKVPGGLSIDGIFYDVHELQKHVQWMDKQKQSLRRRLDVARRGEWSGDSLSTSEHHLQFGTDLRGIQLLLLGWQTEIPLCGSTS